MDGPHAATKIASTQKRAGSAKSAAGQEQCWTALAGLPGQGLGQLSLWRSRKKQSASWDFRTGGCRGHKVAEGGLATGFWLHLEEEGDSCAQREMDVHAYVVQERERGKRK